MDGASHVVVIGAGAGGLAAAIDLAVAGHRVTVVERAAGPGGKLRTAAVAGRDIDTGPTVLTMRWVFDELFAAAGTTLEGRVRLERAEVLARHAWPDGARLDLYADAARSTEAIAEAFGAREAEGYQRLCKQARATWETLEGPFVRAERPGFFELMRRVAPMGAVALTRFDAHRSMWRALGGYFRDPRLRQLFGRYATYVGSSPMLAPATLNLIAHVEAVGVWRVAGGMRRLALALAELACERGATLRYGAPVAEILVRGGRAAGVRLDDGEVIAADAVIHNGDVSALGAGLLGEGARRAARRTRPARRSLSALTWALVARADGFPLVHHNVFFSRDYRAEFAALGRGRVPDEPTVYVCAQDRGDAPIDSGEERLLLVVNAPATGDAPDRWATEERDRCERSVLAATAVLARAGLVLHEIAGARTTPVELHRDFPATGGALYGPATRGPLSSFQRAGSRSRLPGLYLAGGSTHPGAGVPMATLSGRLAAARLRADLASIARSRTVAISGTTSTGSPRTAASRS